MSSVEPNISNLFSQLGLENDESSIKQFIAKHSLEDHTLLPDALFWTPSQSDFIRDQVWEDSIWNQVIDELDEMLRQEG